MFKQGTSSLCSVFEGFLFQKGCNFAMSVCVTRILYLPIQSRCLSSMIHTSQSEVTFSAKDMLAFLLRHRRQISAHMVKSEVPSPYP